MKPVTILLAALLLPMACTSNSLDGTIDATLSLDFDDVRIKKQDAFLVAEYLRETIRGTEKVCKLSLDTLGLDLDAGPPEIEGDDFLQRVVLQRTTFEYDAFPDVEKGRLRFEHFDFQDGGSVEGDFLIVFVDVNTLQGLFVGGIEEM